MQKEIKDLSDFLKKNIFLILSIIVFMGPSMWWIASSYFNERIEQYKVQIEALKLQNTNLLDKNSVLKSIVLQDEESVLDWSKIKSN